MTISRSQSTLGRGQIRPWAPDLHPPCYLFLQTSYTSLVPICEIGVGMLPACRGPLRTSKSKCGYWLKVWTLQPRAWAQIPVLLYGLYILSNLPTSGCPSSPMCNLEPIRIYLIGLLAGLSGLIGSKHPLISRAISLLSHCLGVPMPQSSRLTKRSQFLGDRWSWQHSAPDTDPQRAWWDGERCWDTMRRRTRGIGAIPPHPPPSARHYLRCASLPAPWRGGHARQALG